MQVVNAPGQHGLAGNQEQCEKASHDLRRLFSSFAARKKPTWNDRTKCVTTICLTK
jgi:hypothetical protein